MSAQPKISRAGFSAPGAVTSSPGLQSSRVVGQMANPVGNGVGLYRRDVLATNDLSEYVQIIERHPLRIFLGKRHGNPRRQLST